MTTLISDPEGRKVLADKIEAFNKHQLIKEAATDAQTVIKQDVKDLLGVSASEFARRAMVRRMSQDNPTKYEEVREIDETIHEENDILFKNYKGVKDEAN